MTDLIDRAEELAALCTPPASVIVRDLIAKIRDQQHEIESMHRCFDAADRERRALRADLGIATSRLEACRDAHTTIAAAET